MYKNYNMNQLVLPLEIEYILDKNDIAHLINHFVESIPDGEFMSCVPKDGRPSYHPRMLLKILLCAYTQGIFSGRKIEASVKDSLRMMWLAQGETPSYRTINRFRVHEHTQALLQACFTQFRMRLVASDQIDEEAIYIDGTKIEANAQKYTFVWKKAIETNEKKMATRALELYQELVETEILPAIEDEKTKVSDAQLQLLQSKLTDTVETYTEQIATSSDMTQRKKLRSERKPFKQKLKQVTEMMARKKVYEKHYEILGERNSYSKTDTDATFMRMKDDHMMNGQLKAGYNLQIATEHQYVLGYRVFPNPTDTKTLKPFLHTLMEDFRLPLPPHIVADAGYGSEVNYQYIIDELERIPLITYSTYCKEQKRKHTHNTFHPDNWQYNETEDYYICPNNAVIEFSGYSQITDTSGMRREIKNYRCEAPCQYCPLRNQCTTSKDTRWRKTIRKNMKWEYFKQEIKTLLSDEKTGDLYRQRKIDVEPVFGYLKAILGFTRMSVRGKEQVTNEIGFALMAVNLRKLAKAQGASINNQTKKWIKEVFHFFHPFFLSSKILLSQALSSFHSASL